MAEPESESVHAPASLFPLLLSPFYYTFDLVVRHVVYWGLYITMSFSLFTFLLRASVRNPANVESCSVGEDSTRISDGTVRTLSCLLTTAIIQYYLCPSSHLHSILLSS